MNMAVDEDTLKKADKALNKAKIALMDSPNSAFISTICFSLQHEWDSSVERACTDGRKVMYNPFAYLNLPPAQQLSRLLHETWHVALMHIARVLSRNPEKYNAAADFYINLMLTDAGFEKIPTWLHNPDYRGLSTEQIYDLLPDSFQMPPSEFDLKPNDEDKELSDFLDDVIVRASVQSQMQGDKPGTIPGSIQIYLDSLLNPILPWHSLLRRYMNQLSKDDYSWRKPNRRFFPDNILPTLYSQKMMDIAIFVDASGSVTDKDFHRFISETAGILRMLKPSKITIVRFDTAIRGVDEVRSLKDIAAIKFTGRGGTSIKPVIDWIHDNKPKISLIFSDGHFNHYNRPVADHLIWLVYNNKRFNAPYGKVIHYEV